MLGKVHSPRRNLYGPFLFIFILYTFFGYCQAFCICLFLPENNLKQYRTIIEKAVYKILRLCGAALNWIAYLIKA